MRFAFPAAAIALLAAACSGTPATPVPPPAEPSSSPPASSMPAAAPAPAVVPAGPVKAGDKAPSFRLAVAGAAPEEVALDDVVGQSKATVLMFIATQCPVSNAYNERMAQIAKAYAAKGVAFYGINSNKSEPVDEIVAHAKEHGFSFKVLKDTNNVVADQFHARVTPEIYIVDPQGVVRYHGRIDENQVDAAAAKSHDLANALDALLQGQAPKNPETKAFGCSIKRT